MARSTRTPTGYDASSLQALEGLDPVRKRPAMYIGSTDTRGLTHCVFEIFDNAVDEAVGGYGKKIVVVRHDDGSVEVIDNGRGIPVDVEPTSGLSGVVLVLTKLHAGGKFGGEGGYKVSGGLHGVGASVVNALSERVSVQVRRDGAVWGIEFQRAEPGRMKNGKFSKSAVPERLGKAAKNDTGTAVRFWPDFQIFQADAVVDWERVIARLEQTAYLVPGVEIVFDDRVSGEVRSWRFDGGIAEMLGNTVGQFIAGPLRVAGVATYSEVVQVLTDGALVATEMEREVEIDVAFGWAADFDTDIRSFVNVVETPKGGTHVQGAERAVVKTMTSAMSASKVLKSGETVQKEDVLEGLRMIVSVKLPEPQFEGQTKEILGTSQIVKPVEALVAAELSAMVSGRKTKTALRAVMDKIADAGRARRAAKQQRELVRRKTALETSALPAKLKDCRTHDLERSELLIIEGDSAGGTVGAARDSEFQAYLPIRGKILNVLRASERKMLDNAECQALITAIGAGSGRSFDVERARYAKLIILADADVDGAHIRCLLLTLCWRYMRPLLQAGRVYAAVPPLYRITLKGSGEHIYCYSDAERDATLERLAKEGKAWRDDIQRYKGLGEMDADQLAETTLDPATRQLRRVTIADAQDAERLFGVLMGDDVQDRREFIVTNSNDFDPQRLDV